MAAAPSGSRPPGAGSTASRRRPGACPHVARPNAFNGTSPFLFDGAITRTVEDSALALSVLAGYDPRDPFSRDEEVDWLGATRRSIQGMKVAFSPDLDVFPVDPRVSDVVAKAVRAFEEAGAEVEEVEVGIRRPQQELSDLWCRLIMVNMLLNIEVMKEQGVDLLGEHPQDLPPEVHAWVETGRRLTIRDFARDQSVRTEVYDAIQGSSIPTTCSSPLPSRAFRSRTPATATRSARPR